MAPITLTDLPTEILNMILELLLVRREPLVIRSFQQGKLDFRKIKKHKLQPSILRVSKRLNNLGVKALYGKNRFSLSSFNALQAVALRLSRKYAQLVSKIQVYVVDCSLQDYITKGTLTRYFKNLRRVELDCAWGFWPEDAEKEYGHLAAVKEALLEHPGDKCKVLVIHQWNGRRLFAELGKI
ncbi:hypothetical protein MMC17_007735 [Xylographa soralifera]|nr:hypothetical protein [Xylographa soralifera]